MEIALYFAVPVLAVIALLWVVNRRNPGNYLGDAKAHDHDWGEWQRSDKLDPDRRQGESWPST
jgi:hypothetical protein